MEQINFQKLLEEFDSINESSTKLREYILNEKFKEIDPINRDLMIAQLKAMEAYLSVLSIRIGINTPKDEAMKAESVVGE